jgi:hypothetical protein
LLVKKALHIYLATTPLNVLQSFPKLYKTV